MKKVFNADILDLFITDNGFIYACKEILDDGREAIGFFTYDKKSDLFERIPVKAYIKAKYGNDGLPLAKSLGDFVTCSVRNISSINNIASYDDGTLKIFNSYGLITDTRKVRYMNFPACSPEPSGRDLWMAVPDANAIINYSVRYDRIEFRIGGPEEKAFSHPASIAMYDGCLYVCNTNSFVIKTIGLDAYKVSDFYVFNEPVYKYFRVDNTEYVLLKTGVYSL